MSDIVLRLLLIIGCLAFTAFFAGIETGIISINRLRLRHLVAHRVRGAAILEQFLRRPEVLLGTTLVGTNLCTGFATVLANSLADRIPWPLATALVNLSVTLVILVFCEYLPKAWFQSFPSHRSLPFARLLGACAWVLTPLRVGITSVVHRLLPIRRVETAGAQPFLTREELVHLTREGAQTGALTPEETRMIHSVLELGGKACVQVMVPRDKMVVVEETLPIAALLDQARAQEFNRYPVWNPEKKKFTGIVHIFDVLRDAEWTGKVVRDYMKPPQFVAGRILVDHLMPRMRVTRQPMMLVNDDRFEVIGLITLEDVLTEIVGEE